MIGDFGSRRTSQWRSRMARRLPTGLWTWTRPLALLLLLILGILVFEGSSAFRPPWLARASTFGQTAAPSTTSLWGLPRVVDGDTIVLDGRHVRLDGIDAPESDQICQDRNGPLGRAAGRRRVP